MPAGELLPLVADDSILAVVFLYAPVRFDTALRLTLPPSVTIHRVRELWHGRDWTRQVELADGGGVASIPFSIPADAELFAIHVEFDGSLRTPQP